MTSDSYPKKYDIVIVGAGPVGILLSLCMSRWGYKVKHIDNRPVPTATGRADGIQPRSTEILRNLGLKRKIMSYDPAKVYDVSFWDPRPDGSGIQRTGNWPSCPRFIDTRYPFTTLVHQGKIETAFLDEIKKAGTTVERPWTITGFKNDGLDETYPVQVQLKCLDTNVIETVRAKYLFSGEGARSFVREQLGIQIHHKDPISYVWGVMDGVVRTDFPDIQVSISGAPFEEDFN
jgi:2-polyprenyl-6-methoxyphenol hydroxylase-like FAD-dependent oxidoreductase